MGSTGIYPGTFDPPYDQKIAGSILQLVVKRQLLSENGVLVIQQSSRDEAAAGEGVLTLWKQKKHGKTAVSFYRSNKPEKCILSGGQE